MNEKEYVYALHENGPFNYDSEEEIVETILIWRKQDGTYEGYSFFRGEKVAHRASDFIDTEVLVEGMQDDAYERVGVHTDGWLDHIAPEQVDALCTFIDAWADKHGLQPTFYGVKNIEELKVVDSVTKAELGHE